jgi:hypothetical protein
MSHRDPAGADDGVLIRPTARCNGASVAVLLLLVVSLVGSVVEMAGEPSGVTKAALSALCKSRGGVDVIPCTSDMGGGCGGSAEKAK